MPDQKEILIAAMDRQGMLDNDLRAGTAAICGGETGLQPHTERGYGGTSNERIRDIFQAARSMSDAELNRLKADDDAFFEAMYGAHTKVGRMLGNTEPGDGARFRGRCLLQLTGRGNYQRYGDMIGVDLITAPERANEPDISAALTVAYMLDRYKGGGFEKMKRAVGNTVGSTETTKDRLYEQYRRTGEFDYHAPETGKPVAPRDPQPPLPRASEPQRDNWFIRLIRALFGGS
jgi:predicted chitinase